MNPIYVVLAFVTIISIIVVIHELGHYLAARSVGLVARKFSLGFGKALFSRVDKHGTRWQVSPILLGGYVGFPGDDPKDPPREGELTLEALPRWKRAIVVGAGPGINFLLSAILFAVIAGGWGYPVGKPIVEQVVENSAAQSAGIQIGDRLTKIGSTDITVSNDVTRAVILKPGVRMNIEWERDGKPMTSSAVIGRQIYEDVDGASADVGILGVSMPQAWKKASNPIEALTVGVSDGIFMTWAQIESMKQMVTGERSVEELSGPIRIARASARNISLGLMPFLYFTALVSIAVGVMNLLPVPALDGGHLMTYAIEGTIRRDLPESTKKGMAMAGIGIIAMLGIFALTLDIRALT